MEKICKICALQPGSHSFREIERENEILFFYTKPAEAILYNDTQGILHHYSNMLVSIKEAKWSWIFDMNSFGITHLLNPYLCYSLAILIGKFSKTLQNIFIINPNPYLSQLLILVMPFVPTTMREKIKTIKNLEKTEEISENIKNILVSK